MLLLLPLVAVAVAAGLVAVDLVVAEAYYSVPDLLCHGGGSGVSLRILYISHLPLVGNLLPYGLPRSI